MPEKNLEYYVKRYGGNPFSLRLDGTALGHDPENPRLDPILLRDQVHKFANKRDLGALDNSHTWWDSAPGEMTAANCVSILSCLSSGARPDSQGGVEKGKNKKVLRVKVGEIDRIPKELKH